MKIKKGKCFAIYVSSKVNNEVIDFLSKQNNVSETIFTIITEYINKIKSNELESLSKRVTRLEELIHGNQKSTYDSSMNKNEDSIDMETLFKQLND